MTKKKKILNLDSSDLPQELREQMESFIEELAGGSKKDRPTKPLVTISQKDLIKFIRLKGRREMARSLVKAMIEVEENVTGEMSEWWDYVEDKYDLSHDLELKVDPETGLISQFLDGDKSLELVKDDKHPIN